MEPRNPTGALDRFNQEKEALRNSERNLRLEIGRCRLGILENFPGAAFETACLGFPLAALGVTIGAGLSYLFGGDTSYTMEVFSTGLCGTLVSVVAGGLGLVFRGGDQGLCREGIEPIANPEDPYTFLGGWDRIKGSYLPKMEKLKRQLATVNGLQESIAT